VEIAVFFRIITPQRAHQFMSGPFDRWLAGRDGRSRSWWFGNGAHAREDVVAEDGVLERLRKSLEGMMLLVTPVQ